MTEDPEFKFSLKRDISGSKVCPRRNKLDQINRIVEDLNAFEADKSGRDSIEDFVRKNKRNAAKERLLELKIHDVIEMIQEGANEDDPEILDIILDTKNRNRRID